MRNKRYPRPRDQQTASLRRGDRPEEKSNAVFPPFSQGTWQRWSVKNETDCD